MLSAFRIPRERVEYAMVAFLCKQCLSGPEFADSLRVAAQSRAGRAPLRGWRYM